MVRTRRRTFRVIGCYRSHLPARGGYGTDLRPKHARKLLSRALFVFLLRIFAAYCTRHGVAEGYALVVVGDVIFARPRGFGLRPYAAIHGRIRPIPLLESN